MAVPRPDRATTVVVVDDEPEFLELAGRLLGAGGRFTVVGEARTSAEAVDLVSRLHPDVVLLDILLPDVIGLVTARRVQDAEPGTQVVLVTAGDTAPYQGAAEPLWAVPILSKRDLSAEAVANALGLDAGADPAT